jgi:hypothetical protein
MRTGCCRPSAFPYPPNCMIHQFVLDTGWDTNHVTVLFRYMPDEQRIYVLGIGHTIGG